MVGKLDLSHALRDERAEGRGTSDFCQCICSLESPERARIRLNASRVRGGVACRAVASTRFDFRKSAHRCRVQIAGASLFDWPT